MISEVDECLLTVMSYHDDGAGVTSDNYTTQILGSVSEYIRYRKCISTNLIDMKMPSKNSEKFPRSYSSSEDRTTGQKMFLRFRSLVERPIGAEKMYSVKQQLIKSTSILRHKSPSFTSGLDISDSDSQNHLAKTTSLDRRRNMPDLTGHRSHDGVENNTPGDSSDTQPDATPNEQTSTTDLHNALNAQNTPLTQNTQANNNNVSKAASWVAASNAADNPADSPGTDTGVGGLVATVTGREKDLDRSLEADMHDQERYEEMEQAQPSKGEHFSGINWGGGGGKVGVHWQSVA